MLQIVTDSSCDLPEDLINKYKIRVVPLSVIIDNKAYQEGVDISPLSFYEKMAHSSKLPKTSQPPPESFADIFRELSDIGQVLCLTISSKLSGTYQSACMGKELSATDTIVFDTLCGSLGHGLQVIKACELANAGCKISEITAELDQYRKKMNILILLNTLENIVKGGRLSRFQGSLARIMDIRLILHNVEGGVVLLEKVRGKQKFMHRVMQIIEKRCPDMSGMSAGITHFNNIQDAAGIKKILCDTFNPDEVYLNYMGPTMATYAGEGGMIVSF